MRNYVFLLGLYILLQSTACKKKETSLNLPVLTTDSISGISLNSAIIYYTITSDNGDAVTDRGVCWGKVNPPTIADSKTSDGSGIGVFASNLSGLGYANHYYVRAYASNSAGTGYGIVFGFTTEGRLPVSAFSSAIESDSGNVVLAGTVIANFLPTRVIFEYRKGAYYLDTISGNPATVYGDSATTTTALIRGLSKGTFYHFRIRALNALGANYSAEDTLTTSAF